MDYKELVERLNEWNENLISKLCADDVLTCDDLCGCTGDCIVVQAATAITDLLARAEAAEKELVKCREKNAGLAMALLTEQPPNPDCLGDREWQEVRNHLRSVRDRAEAAEARVRELETSFRTEKCENRPECMELGRVRKALAEAEALAEKAERERDDFKAKYIEAVNRACKLSKIVDDHGWEE